MIPYPPVSPDLVRVGPLRVRWYGAMYLLGFLVGRQILVRLARKMFLRLSPEMIDDFLVALFLGMLVGARAAYMIIYYEPSPQAPFSWWYTPFALWEGGLSFHGGAAGMLVVCWLIARRRRVPFASLSDSLAIAAGPGVFFGRIGNFFNAELYGRETTVPWAMSFPIRDVSGHILDWTTPRHPSQIYEAVAEGLCTFLLLWWLHRRVSRHGIVTAVAVMWYGLVRFFLEFYREKDPQMPYYFGWMTMGQLLCSVMVLAGTAGLVIAVRRGSPVQSRS